MMSRLAKMRQHLVASSSASPARRAAAVASMAAQQQLRQGGGASLGLGLGVSPSMPSAGAASSSLRTPYVGPGLSLGSGLTTPVMPGTATGFAGAAGGLSAGAQHTQHAQQQPMLRPFQAADAMALTHARAAAAAAQATALESTAALVHATQARQAAVRAALAATGPNKVSTASASTLASNFLSSSGGSLSSGLRGGAGAGASGGLGMGAGLRDFAQGASQPYSGMAAAAQYSQLSSASNLIRKAAEVIGSSSLKASVSAAAAMAGGAGISRRGRYDR